jgi:hypothetical protein
MLASLRLAKHLREMKFRGMQVAFPNGVWERGNNCADGLADGRACGGYLGNGYHGKMRQLQKMLYVTIPRHAENP